MIDGSTRVFAILGDPVAHSLSPAMQNAAFRVSGLKAVYVPLRCAADDLPGLLRALSRAGGGGNVTVPHKEAAARAVDRCEPAADRLGACNTFWGEDGACVGDNTDVAGVLAALDDLEAPPGALAGARHRRWRAGGGRGGAGARRRRGGASPARPTGGDGSRTGPRRRA